MFTGGNPFVDESTTVRLEGVPRIRITEINATNVVLAVELMDANGYPLLTFNRACLRVGDTLNLSDITIDLRVTHKEK